MLRAPFFPGKFLVKYVTSPTCGTGTSLRRCCQEPLHSFMRKNCTVQTPARGKEALMTVEKRLAFSKMAHNRGGMKSEIYKIVGALEEKWNISNIDKSTVFTDRSQQCVETPIRNAFSSRKQILAFFFYHVLASCEQYKNDWLCKKVWSGNFWMKIVCQIRLLSFIYPPKGYLNVSLYSVTSILLQWKAFF